jgi:hypothetical protein
LPHVRAKRLIISGLSSPALVDNNRMLRSLRYRSDFAAPFIGLQGSSSCQMTDGTTLEQNNGPLRGGSSAPNLGFPTTPIGKAGIMGVAAKPRSSSPDSRNTLIREERFIVGCDGRSPIARHNFAILGSSRRMQYGSGINSRQIE